MPTMSKAVGLATLGNYIDGEFRPASPSSLLAVSNPATGETIAQVPLCIAADLDAAAQAAQRAFPAWRRMPPAERVKYLFKYKNILEEHFEEIARILTQEHGKTLNEARGDLRRGIDNLDVAVGIPSLMQGEALEDVGRGIDCTAARRPLGVFGIIAPFNFPAMVPLWFLPYAIATGNTVVLKPSEQVPLTQQRMFELLHEVGLPKGVVNLVHGGKEIVQAICEHPLIKGVSFVGSSPVAQYVYETGTKHGKRVQALGGAKNFIVVMPDADLEATTSILVESCYGCAGERCLAGSTLILVGEAYGKFREALIARIKAIKVGNGLDDGIDMGPVISEAHRAKVLALVEQGIAEGAKVLVDGRKTYADRAGYFIGPILLDEVRPEMVIANEEVFGPVMCLMRAATLQEAIDILEAHPYGNTTSIFTASGKSARDFCYEVSPTMVGVNIGVAAPMSFFQFGGAKGSFYGDIKAHGKHSIEFYTDRRTVMTRWF